MTPIIVPRTGDEPSRFANVEVRRARKIAQSAARALSEAIEARKACVIENERQRRRRFNASWKGKVFFFLRKDPDGPISAGPRADESIASWSDTDFELKMLEHFLEQARDVARVARSGTGCLRIKQDEWDRMLGWAAPE